MEIQKSSEKDKRAVHEMLRNFNTEFMCECVDYSYHLESGGNVVAGIVAESVFDTVEVEFLFVSEEYRGKGYGKALLRQVEEEAKNRQMKRILLNTYSFQAPDFYEKMGYVCLFKVDPVFKDHSQSYYIKML